ncbi:MAG: phosphoribosylamine--glycine ligase [Bacteroidetes bacterium HGW-Bacteroidetes-1]|jgi:phosphoribosylamine--glycine ligase|nr:MAG: phosphoribosylamine--glycine ligase [Bacteroidetes bacterium HGW-Bacteroidetes-1]
MNILLLGSGGRENALAWKLKQSSAIKKIFIAPGNAGTALYGTNLPVDTIDFEQIRYICIENNISMVVVGPEVPLVAGITDFFQNDIVLKDIAVIGPSSQGAMLEGRKAFAKSFMLRHNIPTAGYKSITNENLKEGLEFLKTLKPPYVLKANGLAAGKGVLILQTLEEASRELQAMLAGKFGKASHEVVIEEFLKGVELSSFVITDGKNYKLLPSAKDYKRIGEGDTGPNTGGMGAVSPVVFADKQFMEKVISRVIEPTIKGLEAENIDYKGFIFFGLMNVKGDPFVIEYNVRLGDPETECILPRITSDFFALLDACANQKLGDCKIQIDDRYAVTVMLVSGGYPDEYKKGKSISGLDAVSDCVVFHAGTTIDLKNETIKTSGGRVIAVTALDFSLQDAKQKAMANALKIKFEDCYHRSDIADDLIKYRTI